MALVIVKVRVDHEPSAAEIEKREAKWLKLIEAKKYACVWHKRGDLLFSSAIQLPIGKGGEMKRAAMTAKTQAKVATLLKASLLTKEEADLLFKEAHHIAPVVSRPTGQGSPTSASLESMIAISDRIDMLAKGETFLDNDGKLYLRGAAAGEAINCGLVDKPEPRQPNVPPKRGNGLHMWQDVGRRHPETHIDGTQFARFVRHLKEGEGNALYDTPRSYYPEHSQYALQWQRFLQSLSFGHADEKLHPGKADAAHGPKTQAATEYYLSGEWVDEKPKAKPKKKAKAKINYKVRTVQRRLQKLAKEHSDPKLHPGKADGILGPKTQAAKDYYDSGDWKKPEPPYEMPPTSFKQAEDYHKGRRDPLTGKAIKPNKIIIHVAQIDEVMTAAESLQRWAEGPIKVSWHGAIDADSVAMSVRREDTAFAAPGANHDGIQYELAGYVEQSTEEWHDDYSIRTLDNAAKVIAKDCFDLDIPVIKFGMIELRDGSPPAVYGHWDVSLAFEKSTHTDPGERFPWSYLIERIQYYYNLLKG